MRLRSGSCSALSTDFSARPTLRDAFETYIERALIEEIDRIPAHYGERDGGFWVAVRGDKVVGTFGLERASDDAMELRHMYVDPSARRQGIARRMLVVAFAECICYQMFGINRYRTCCVYWT